MCITGRSVCGQHFCGGPPRGPRIAPVVAICIRGVWLPHIVCMGAWNCEVGEGELPRYVK